MKQIKNHTQLLVDSARNYIGRPFHFKGRSKGGMDCAGHVILSLRDANIVPKDYDFLAYNINPSPRIIKKELLSLFDLVDSLLSGDILLINLYGLPQHVAIYSENSTIIHTYKDIGKVIEEKFSKYYKDRLDSIYRIRG